MSTVFHLLLVQCLCFFIQFTESIQPSRLRVEYESNPVGIDVTNPRFFWAINSESNERGAQQSAYNIIIYNEDNGKTIINTTQQSSQSSHITIPNLVLTSHTNYRWTVQIYDKSNTASSVVSAYFSTAILAQDKSEWNNASWIGIAKSDSPTMNEFRTEFMINSSLSIKKGIAYIVNPGYYKLWLNGELIDKHELGYFTTFQTRAYYDVVPITNLLNDNGINVIGVMLGNGWYSQPTIDLGANMIKIIIYIQFDNDDIMRVYSNNKDWYQSEGPIRYNDIYNGEWYDATKETPGWLEANYDYSLWKKASLITNPVIGELKSAAIMAKIRKTDSYSALSITEPAEGVYVIDFGQNVAGFCKIVIPGNYLRGKNVTIIHSEELRQNGYINEMWPEKAPMMFNITLRGDGNEEIYIPFFTYFGYQYIQITGYPGIPTQNDFISYFMHSDFDTSSGSIQYGPSNINNPLSNAYLMNYVQHMTRFAALSNFMNIPTDCPQRERRGWLGDAQLSAETLIYNFDMASAYTKFLYDIKDVQEIVNASGALPECAPFYNHGHKAPGDPAWTTAYVNLVYWMYHYYGDIRVVNTHYDGLKAYMNVMGNELDTKTGLLDIQYSIHGDWDGLFDINECPHKSSLINSFDWTQQCQFMSILANAIGNDNDSKYYLNQYNIAKENMYKYYWDKTQNIFIDPAGQLSVQSSQSLALYLDILNDTNELNECVTNLVKDITITHNHHIGTGIVGTKAIWPQLCRFGYCGVALNASMQREIPGYGWWFLQGATTLWEHWQATRYNSSKCGGIGSKNHIMFGGQGSWYFSGLGGIKPKYLNVSNWKEIIIDPYTNSTIYNISFINTQVDTLNGPIIVEFEIYSGGINKLYERLNVVIPTGSIATVYFRRIAGFNSYVPIQNWIIKEGSTIIWQNMKYVNGDSGIINGMNDGDDTLMFEIESGEYSFTLQT